MGAQSQPDASRRLGSDLMLPYSDHVPPGVSELPIGVTISSAVGL